MLRRGVAGSTVAGRGVDLNFCGEILKSENLLRKPQVNSLYSIQFKSKLAGLVFKSQQLKYKYLLTKWRFGIYRVVSKRKHWKQF